MSSSRKYKRALFTGVELPVNGKIVKVHRLKALRDIPKYSITKGMLSGLIDDNAKLDQDGDCWIGYDATVIGNASIKDDAYVGGKSFINAGKGITWLKLTNDEKVPVNLTLIVSDNVYISGEAVIDFSYENPSGSMLINAIHSAKSDTNTSVAIIAGDTTIGGKTRMHKPDYINGKVAIRDAIISTGLTAVGDNISIIGRSVIGHNVTLREDIDISGDSTVGSNVNISGSVKVLSHAKIENNVSIRGLVTVKDGGIVSQGSVIEKAPFLTTITIGRNQVFNAETKKIETKEPATPKGANLFAPNMMTDSQKGKLTADVSENFKKILLKDNSFGLKPNPNYNPNHGKNKNSYTEGQQLWVTKFKEVEALIDAYKTDIVKLLKYPVMSDMTDPFTADMILALKRAEMVIAQKQTEKFEESISALEHKFLIAESNAQRIATSHLDENQKRNLTQARDLFNIALNEASTENEKRMSFKKGFSQLEGVVAITDKTVDALRVRIGLPELEM